MRSSSDWLLVTSLNLCSGKFGAPITDDVTKLTILKQNIPSDYEIPISYIPKEVGGSCWVVLNIYPLEQSLRNLANMFGAISSNKENIIVFIAMVKSLRFTFDHEELVSDRLLSGLYFDYIKDILHTATQGTSGFSCKPPPCLNSQHTPGTVTVVSNAFDHFLLAGGQEDNRRFSWSKRAPLLLALIPFTACVVLIVCLVSMQAVNFFVPHTPEIMKNLPRPIPF
uniref:Kit ligand n=1 Tax=Salarias fasciatus TaxID=181472 RepID=A0A672JQA6_SALFA